MNQPQLSAEDLAALRSCTSTLQAILTRLPASDQELVLRSPDNQQLFVSVNFWIVNRMLNINWLFRSLLTDTNPAHQGIADPPTHKHRRSFYQ